MQTLVSGLVCRISYGVIDRTVSSFETSWFGMQLNRHLPRFFCVSDMNNVIGVRWTSSLFLKECMIWFTWGLALQHRLWCDIRRMYIVFSYAGPIRYERLSLSFDVQTHARYGSGQGCTCRTANVSIVGRRCSCSGFPWLRWQKPAR